MRYRTRLYVDLNILADNYSLLKKLCPDNDVLFMVKANAYGHGLVPMVRFAANELGIKEFGCATLGEARILRDELSDGRFEVYVFSDIHLEYQSCSDLYLNRRIIPVIANMHDLDFLLNNKSFRHFPVCLKFNTGMNRLGFRQEETELVIQKLKKAGRSEVYHLLSHFASASSSIITNKISEQQYKSFLEIKQMFKDANIAVQKSSISNSGATEQKFGLEESHIRPGLILYGPTALNKGSRTESLWTGKNISRLETYIISTFPVKKGDRIGYGSIPAPSDGVMALIALGYGDGFSCRFKNPTLEFNGVKGRIFGRVNMDMTLIFFSGEVPKGLKDGENFVIWGHDPQDILNFSDETDAIPYEHFCHLTNRIPRVYSIET